MHDPEAILAAITRLDGTEFQEHESYAANRLHLTEQVPARHVYLTTGRSRIIKAGQLNKRCAGGRLRPIAQGR